MSVVVATRHPDIARDEAHSETVSENEGATESIKTVRDEPREIFLAVSCAKN